MQETQAGLAEALVGDLERLDDVERVSLVRFDTGLLEIELFTVWASQDRQPDVSWGIVNGLADAFAGTSREYRRALTGSDDLALSLTTYSAGGDYRYRSETDFATMGKLKNRASPMRNGSS
jgi:hypothetical protein